MLQVPARQRSAPPLTGAILLLVVALPALAAAFAVAWRPWYAGSDQAIMLVRIFDVGGSHTPLVGAWSRWGWSHPGPSTYWALAPFAQVLGPAGALTGAGVINAASILGSVALVLRRGGRARAATAALALAVAVHAAGAGQLVDIWNPTIALFPFFLFLFLVWSVLCGDRWLLPAAAAVGSFSVQAHIGYALVVAGLLLAAAVRTALARRHDDVSLTRPQRLLVWASAATLLVMWLPPLVEQASAGRGNVTALIRYGMEPDEPAAGWSYAVGVFGWQLRPTGPWLSGQEVNGLGFTVTGSAVPALGSVLVVALATCWAARRGARDVAWLGVISLLGAGLALVATAQVRGIPVPYLVRWWWGIAALATLTVAWALLEATSGRVRQVLLGAALVALVVTSGRTLLSLPAPVPGAEVSRAIGAVAPGVADQLDPAGRYLVRSVASSTWGAPGPGLLLELERRGFDVFVDPAPLAGSAYGERRVAAPAEVDEIITFVDRLDADGWAPPRGSRLLATWEDDDVGATVWASPTV